MIKKDGFKYSFNPAKCDECGGKCCVGSSGYIWVSELEISNISKLLNVSTGLFKSDYVYKYKNRYSIKELKVGNEYECLFFKHGKCQIYDVRPSQCKKFPFWEDFRGKDKSSLDYLKNECIGVEFE